MGTPKEDMSISWDAVQLEPAPIDSGERWLVPRLATGPADRLWTRLGQDLPSAFVGPVVETVSVLCIATRATANAEGQWGPAVRHWLQGVKQTLEGSAALLPAAVPHDHLAMFALLTGGSDGQHAQDAGRVALAIRDLDVAHGLGGFAAGVSVHIGVNTGVVSFRREGGCPEMECVGWHFAVGAPDCPWQRPGWYRSLGLHVPTRCSRIPAVHDSGRESRGTARSAAGAGQTSA